MGKTLHAEAHSVHRLRIHVVDVERTIFGRRREPGLLLEEVEDVVVRDVSGWGHGAIVESYRLGGVDEGAVGSGEREPGLPEMEACCPVRVDSGGEGELCRGELGRIDAGGRNGEIDQEKGVGLLGR